MVVLQVSNDFILFSVVDVIIENNPTDFLDSGSLVGINVVDVHLACSFFYWLLILDQWLVLKNLEWDILTLVALILLNFEDFVNKSLAVDFSLVALLLHGDVPRKGEESLLDETILAEFLEVFLNEIISASIEEFVVVQMNVNVSIQQVEKSVLRKWLVRKSPSDLI